jgi:DNA-binding LacI/PurR family transcriptional regulator
MLTGRQRRLEGKLDMAITARRGPSMTDVAAAAGVSAQTVSRVSNGKKNVDSETRDRVVSAMRELGYRPNSAARALKTGQFRNIGVIMFDLSSIGNMRTLDGIATAASESGYSITLMSVAHPIQRELDGAFTRLGEQAIDGVVIIIEAALVDRGEVELPPGVPVVVIDSDAGPEYTVVDSDQAQGAHLATQHLLDLGHSTVWHVGGPRASFAAVRREKSWRETLEAAGAVVPPVMVGDWSSDSGYRVGLELGANPDVTAIFACNDQMALGVLRALHELDRAVPASVSVVGFDDMSESESFWPPLTTVHQAFAEVGRLALNVLLQEIETTSHIPGRTIVPMRLTTRSSTAPAPVPATLR